MSQTQTEEAEVLSAENADGGEEKPVTYEELCALYGNPHGWKSDPKETLCAAAAFTAMILMFLLTVICYSRPVVILGENTIFGDTINCFAFAELKLNRIETFFENIGSSPSETLNIYGAIQDVFAFLITIDALAAQVVMIIIALVKLTERQTVSVLKMLFRSVICNGHIYLVFNYICNVSGGEGNNFYYIGDATGIGMNVGTLVAAGILIACLVLINVKNGKTIKENNLVRKYVSDFVNFLFCAAVLCILTQIPLSRALTYSMNNLLGSTVGAILTNSFSFSSLTFTVLNLLIAFLPIAAFNSGTSFGLLKLKVMLQPENEFEAPLQNIPKKRRQKGRPYRYLIIFAICFVAAALLHIPQIGLGWSCNVAPYFLSLLSVSVIWCAIHFALSRKPKNPTE